MDAGENYVDKKERKTDKKLCKRGFGENHRSVYVWANEHIRARFTTCFTSLILLRLLKAKFDNKKFVILPRKALVHYIDKSSEPSSYLLGFSDFASKLEMSSSAFI